MNYEFTWYESTSGKNSERLSQRWWILLAVEHLHILKFRTLLICVVSQRRWSSNRPFNSICWVIRR